MTFWVKNLLKTSSEIITDFLQTDVIDRLTVDVFCTLHMSLAAFREVSYLDIMLRRMKMLPNDVMINFSKGIENFEVVKTIL